MSETPPRSNWPGIEDLVNYGLQGVLYFVGLPLLMWGLFGYWPPTATNGRAMLGFAFLCWARGLHYCGRVTYDEPAPPHKRRLDFLELVWFIASFVGGGLFFLAFLWGVNPLTRLTGHP